eukprot:g8216.t1
MLALPFSSLFARCLLFAVLPERIDQGTKLEPSSVSVVINYDLPVVRENYIHRIGRSGRYGRKGVAINFVTQRDIASMRDLENFYHTKLEELPSNVQALFNKDF